MFHAVFFLHQFDLHRYAVWHFLIQIEQQLFPDDLSDQLALGLVGHHAVGKQLRRFKAHFLQFFHQDVQAIAGPGADRDHSLELMGLSIGGDHGQQGLLFHRIDLVDDQHCGQVVFLDLVQQHLLRNTDACHRLHQQQCSVHVRHSIGDDLHHIIAQPGLWLVQAGGIQKDHLAIVPVKNAGDPGAGSLGLIRNDGHLAAAQGVGQGGLSHVRTAHHRKNTGFRDHICFSSFHHRRSRPCRLSGYLFARPAQPQHRQDLLFLLPHGGLFRAFVHMVIAQQMQHTVDRQIGAFPCQAVTVFPRLLPGAFR